MFKKTGQFFSDQVSMLTSKLGPVFALLLIFLIFGSIKPDLFFTFQNFSNVVGQTVVIAVAAIGMTFIIVSAGIDLSVGSVVALAGVYTTMVISVDYFNLSLIWGLAAGLLTGAVCGLINGLFITKFKLAPFIVTLGMMEIVRGVALQSCGGMPVYDLPNSFSNIGNAVWEITLLKSDEFSADELKFRNLAIRFKEANDPLSHYIQSNLSSETRTQLEQFNINQQPNEALRTNIVSDLNRIIRQEPIYNEERFESIQLTDRVMERVKKNPPEPELYHLNRLLLEEAYPNLIDKGDMILMLPYCLFILIPLGFVAGFILKYTVFGTQVYAVGSNEQTARLCGVNVNKIKILVYLIGGLAAGLAGILHASRLNTGQPSEALGMELEVIAAVVIGGGSLMGGEGTILGSVVGAFIIKFLRNGCNLIGVSSFVQRIVIGLIIIIAVFADQLRRRALSKRTGG